MSKKYKEFKVLFLVHCVVVVFDSLLWNNFLIIACIPLTIGPNTSSSDENENLPTKNTNIGT